MNTETSRPNDDRQGPPATTDDLRLVAALRAGDDIAFTWLIDSYHTALVRLATVYVQSYQEAEEVAQETWLGVYRGIMRFEGRSSLKTWIFRILINQARRRGRQGGRTIPFSSVWSEEAEPAEPAVDPDRFYPPGNEHAGRWSLSPRDWGQNPEKRLLATETREVIVRAIATLPPNQREVITLRDVEGWSAEEACHVLEITDGNQRVLLHRARSRVRQTLETYLQGG
jgi:RNA polymerase sigma-70 factor (ECF subfamily)